ncbi:glycosyltransferase family 2 protein [Myroides odoratimimus]|uniref:glycosyltransferase family 2 protein n=1 Tax=Myroides odoratimimus TaxID=76832 RepID=UPI0029C05855|nr:glycosyltransferase family A protein [Myroides odoratimimus]MDX4975371.1 glycosyltransferase family A protein [Myroides odoratimimus]
MKKISVVIPMYNSSETIIRSLDSVMNQSCQKCRYEVLIVNDGSKDNSAVLVEEFIQNNKKENYTFKLINQDNGGVSKARNTGLKNSTGEFIAFLDSDDEWYNDKIEKQLPYLLNNTADFISCLRNTDKISFPYKLKGEFAIVTLKKLLFKVVGQTSTALFKSEILQDIGYFDIDQHYSEDANLWMRIANSYKMIILNQKLVTTGGGKPSVGHSGLSANIYEMEKGVQKNIKEMRDLKFINQLEFIFFKIFSKIKYVIRKIRY